MDTPLPSDPAAARPAHGARASRSAIFLLLFFGTNVSASRLAEHGAALGDRVGSLLLSSLFLVLSIVFAFVDRNRVLRVLAPLLALVTLVAFTIGFRDGLGRRRQLQRAEQEIDHLKADLVGDLKGEQSAGLDRDVWLQKMDEASGRLMTSEHADVAAMGRALRVTAEATREPGERLDAATERMDGRFLDVYGMVREGDFESQSEVAREYRAAAEHGLEVLGTLPQLAQRTLEGAGASDECVQGMLVGLRRTLTRQRSLLDAHVEAAGSYQALIDFVAEHRADFALDDARRAFDLLDPALAASYGELQERVRTAEERLRAASEALVRSLQQS